MKQPLAETLAAKLKELPRYEASRYSGMIKNDKGPWLKQTDVLALAAQTIGGGPPHDCNCVCAKCIAEAPAWIEGYKAAAEELSERKGGERGTPQGCEKQYHLHVWTVEPHWVAVAQAEDVAHAREIMLEEIGGGDGSCPEREKAAKYVREMVPAIWHRRNAEFALTDSAELREMEHYTESLQQQIKQLKAAAPSDPQTLPQQFETKGPHVTPETCPTCGEDGPRDPIMWARLCNDAWHYPNRRDGVREQEHLTLPEALVNFRQAAMDLILGGESEQITADFVRLCERWQVRVVEPRNE